MSSRNFDRALAVLHGLEASANPQVAARAQQSLQQLQQMKASGFFAAPPQRTPSADAAGKQDDDDEDEPPRLQRKPSVEASKPPDAQKVTTKHMLAVITSIDCSKAPSAAVTAVANGTTWKLAVQDVQRVILFGTPKFSCAWSNQKAGLDYLETGSGEGMLVSVQLMK
jgi:hypothetical protein